MSNSRESTEELFTHTALNYHKYGTSYPEQNLLVEKLQQYAQANYPDDEQLQTMLKELLKEVKVRRSL